MWATDMILLHILQKIILSIPWLMSILSNLSRDLLCLIDILNYFLVIYACNT
jgi:hypothetical protein